MSAEDLAAACVEGFDIEVKIAASIEDAVAQAAEDGDPVRVLVTGSLYLAGHVLALNSGMAKVGPSGASIIPER